MQYISQFRDPVAIANIVAKIKQISQGQKTYRFMEFCGGHTHAVYRFALNQLLPPNIELIHGPGCPVCVLPIERIDYAIYLSHKEGVIFCSYADMLRVPATDGNSLLKSKAVGADVRMVYSVEDALAIARSNPNREIIFFAIGFETTTPPTAYAITQAHKENLKNFKVYCNHVLTPVAMQAIVTGDTNVLIDGFIGPSHVSVVIGSNAYHEIAIKYHTPVVISGFEPLDILQCIYMLVDMVNNCEVGVKNQYLRAVSHSGNKCAQDIIKKVFSVRDNFVWRGLGSIAKSGLKINQEYLDFDCEVKYQQPQRIVAENKACVCPQVLTGYMKPTQCKLFKIVCTPENPVGACMVSSEGACAAYYQYSVE